MLRAGIGGAGGGAPLDSDSEEESLVAALSSNLLNADPGPQADCAGDGDDEAAFLERTVEVTRTLQTARPVPIPLDESCITERRPPAVARKDSQLKNGASANFQQRLQMLTSSEEVTRSFSTKLFARFAGDAAKLSSVIKILEERWGFPDRLFPLLWTHLRRAANRSRKEDNVKLQRITIGSREIEVPSNITGEEWREAFVKWVSALQTRVGNARLSRRGFVRAHCASPEDEYLRGPKLGEGAYGEVHVMFHKALGVERIAKTIQKDQLSIAEEGAQDELNALKSLDHPHIIRIYEAFEMDGGMHIVMDYAEGGDLASLLERAQANGIQLREIFVRKITQQVTGALEYMHRKGVIHCDLKPANTMLLRPVSLENDAVPPHALLVDFGISQIFEQRHIGNAFRMKGTPFYLSPEGFDGHLSEKSDMWALGVMLYEMLLSRRPFVAEGPNNIVVLWSRTLTVEPPLEGMPRLAQEVVRGLLAKDPIMRLTAKECRALEWFECALRVQEHDQPALLREGSTPVKALGHASYFHRVAMFAMATAFSMKDMGELLAVFQAMDRDKLGLLSLEQFADGLKHLGIKQDPQPLMVLLDMDKTGSISYTEFVAGVLSTQDDLPEGYVREVFDMFDLDGDGYITSHELEAVLSGGGPLVEVLPDGQTIDEIITEAAGHDGRISFDDFMDYLKSVARSQPVAPFCRTGFDLSPVAAKPGTKEGGPGHRQARMRARSEEALISQMMGDLEEHDADVQLSQATVQLQARAAAEEANPAPLLSRGSSRPDPQDGADRQDGAPWPTVAASDTTDSHSDSSRRRSAQHAMPPLSRWLLNAVGESTEQREAVRKFLAFPESSLDDLLENPGVLESVGRHFLAGVSLVRLLTQGGARPEDGAALRAALAADLAAAAPAMALVEPPAALAEVAAGSEAPRRLASGSPNQHRHSFLAGSAAHRNSCRSTPCLVPPAGGGYSRRCSSDRRSARGSSVHKGAVATATMPSGKLPPLAVRGEQTPLRRNRRRGVLKRLPKHSGVVGGTAASMVPPPLLPPMARKPGAAAAVAAATAIAVATHSGFSNPADVAGSGGPGGGGAAYLVGREPPSPEPPPHRGMLSPSGGGSPSAQRRSSPKPGGVHAIGAGGGPLPLRRASPSPPGHLRGASPSLTSGAGVGASRLLTPSPTTLQRNPAACWPTAAGGRAKGGEMVVNPALLVRHGLPSSVAPRRSDHDVGSAALAAPEAQPLPRMGTRARSCSALKGQ